MGGAEKIISKGNCSGANVMIFVTVGTDHHPFDRLVRDVDGLKAMGVISEDVFIQTGSSDYLPDHCSFEKLLPFDSLMKKIATARIVITHGGPGSIMPVIYAQKIPVVMPRRKQYGEVVDDHQMDFAKRLQDQNMIILVESSEDLHNAIIDYENLVRKATGGFDLENHKKRLSQFVSKLDELCSRLTAGEKIR